MLQQKIGRTKCPTKVAISSDIGKFCSAIVRWPTVICNPEDRTIEDLRNHNLQLQLDLTRTKLELLKLQRESALNSLPKIMETNYPPKSSWPSGAS